MQIIEIKKSNLNVFNIDADFQKSTLNIKNYLNLNKKVIYADECTNNTDYLKLDLENIKIFNGTTFKNFLSFNFLEHVYNFQNYLKNNYLIFPKYGLFYGLVPFLRLENEIK
tara:strand:+ start:179 stop:514 length:336 start_codon:yes stop_codon:yes gene_type:complete